VAHPFVSEVDGRISSDGAGSVPGMCGRYATTRSSADLSSIFEAYDESGDLCMTLQAGVKFQEYFRCYVVNQQQVHVMRYDPGQPHHLRYVPGNPPPSPELGERIVADSLKLCRALGYDLNTVEFAVEGGIPYAIDFMNPAPDAGLESVGPENFRWIVEAVADMAIGRALQPASVTQFHWSNFLSGK